MLRYLARIAGDRYKLKVSSADIPGALIGTWTRKETLALAVNELTAAMDFCFAIRRQLPAHSAARRGAVVVDLPPSLVAKELLPNEMLRAVKSAELAKR